MRTATGKKGGGKEVDNLELHQRMYERRLRLLKDRQAHPNSDPDGASDTEIAKEESTEENEE
jgi:hypothetical protein